MSVIEKEKEVMTYNPCQTRAKTSKLLFSNMSKRYTRPVQLKDLMALMTFSTSMPGYLQSLLKTEEAT